MVKIAMFEVLPPGFDTVTFTVPGVVMRLAVTVAVNWLELTRVVTSGTAPKTMVGGTGGGVAMFCTKSAPFTMSVKAGPPAVRTAGLIEVMEGGLMTKVW